MGDEEEHCGMNIGKRMILSFCCTDLLGGNIEIISVPKSIMLSLSIQSLSLWLSS